MGSETLPSACYILSDESSKRVYFTLRVTGIKSRQNSCAEKDKVELPSQSQIKASKPNVYEVINNDEVRKVVTLRK